MLHLKIEKSLPLLVGSLMGEHEHPPCSDGVNYCTSHAIVEIDIVGLHSKAATEVSSVSCNLNFSDFHCKEEFDYITGSYGKWKWVSRRCSQCADFGVNNWSYNYCKRYHSSFYNDGSGIRKVYHRLLWIKHIDDDSFSGDDP